MAKISAARRGFPSGAALHFGADGSTTGGVTRRTRCWAISHRRARALILRRTARHRADHPPDAPEGFQRSEFLVEHGIVDLITPRAR
jgi:hypothetical protein